MARDPFGTPTRGKGGSIGASTIAKSKAGGYQNALFGKGGGSSYEGSPKDQAEDAAGSMSAPAAPATRF